eukprot:m.255353 g.255353  ORF g.255353 m.255353 type:complete len:135 (+) comp54541_c0_seq46:1399-1803(+)
MRRRLQATPTSSVACASMISTLFRAPMTCTFFARALLSRLCLFLLRSELSSCGLDRLIIVWDWKTGERLYTLQGPRQRVFRVDFDLTQLISSSQDEKIVLWSFDAPTGGGSPVRLAAPSRPQVSRFHPPGYSDV